MRSGFNPVFFERGEKGRGVVRLLSLVFVGWILVSCATLPTPDVPYSAGYREKGVASWYGIPFHGRKTANGDVYDMHKMTAAHRLMPLGTTVRVTNLKNGRSVRVLVNDRGPFIKGRTLDLSFGAAKRLRMVQTGTAPIGLEVIAPPKTTGRALGNRYTVQVGAFREHSRAKKLAEDLSLEFSHVRLTGESGSGVFRVRVGSKRQKQQAVLLADKISKETGLTTFVTLKTP